MNSENETVPQALSFPLGDALAQAVRWQAAGEDVALATVIHIRGATPVPVGSHLAVTADGRLAGTVSAGGCVEAEIVDAAQRLLHRGGGVRHLTWNDSGAGRTRFGQPPLDAGAALMCCSRGHGIGAQRRAGRANGTGGRWPC